MGRISDVLYIRYQLGYQIPYRYGQSSGLPDILYIIFNILCNYCVSILGIGDRGLWGATKCSDENVLRYFVYQNKNVYIEIYKGYNWIRGGFKSIFSSLFSCATYLMLLSRVCTICEFQATQPVFMLRGLCKHSLLDRLVRFFFNLP